MFFPVKALWPPGRNKLAVEQRLIRFMCGEPRAARRGASVPNRLRCLRLCLYCGGGLPRCPPPPPSWSPQRRKRGVSSRPLQAAPPCGKPAPAAQAALSSRGPASSGSTGPAPSAGPAGAAAAPLLGPLS
jgi:hypothetical protein